MMSSKIFNECELLLLYWIFLLLANIINSIFFSSHLLFFSTKLSNNLFYWYHTSFLNVHLLLRFFGCQVRNVLSSIIRALKDQWVRNFLNPFHRATEADLWPSLLCMVYSSHNDNADQSWETNSAFFQCSWEFQVLTNYIH